MGIDKIDGSVALVSDFGWGGANSVGHLLRSLGATPLLVHSSTAEEDLLGKWRDQYAEVALLDDVYDPDEIARAASESAGRQGVPLQGVFSAFDGLLVPAATAAAKLGLPHPPLDGLRNARIKYLTRKVSRDAGLPTPRFGLIDDRTQARAVADEVGLPAVVKPVNGTAGHLIRIVDSVEALQDAYDHLAAHISGQFGGLYEPLELDEDTRSSIDPCRCFLVEEQMHGPEFAAEVVVRDGVVSRSVLLDKFLVEPVTTYEQGFTWPPFIPSDVQERIWQLVEDTLHALGVDDTICHVEVMLTPDGPYLIEVNAGRTGGGLIYKMPPRITGINNGDELLSLVCGLAPPTRATPVPPRRLTNLTIYPERGGTLVRVHGLEELEALEGVEDVVPGVRPGEEIDIDREVHGVNFFAVDVTERDDLLDLFAEASSIVSFEFEH